MAKPRADRDVSASDKKRARAKADKVFEKKVKKDEASAYYQNARKRCKEAGFDPKVVTDLMKYEQEDPLAVALYFKQLSQGAEAVGIAIQQEMPFTGSGDGVSREAQILDDGIKAGLAAKGTDTSPHDESTPAGQIWLQGWHIGQARNMSGIKQTPPEDLEGATAH